MASTKLQALVFWNRTSFQVVTMIQWPLNCQVLPAANWHLLTSSCSCCRWSRTTGCSWWSQRTGQPKRPSLWGRESLKCQIKFLKSKISTYGGQVVCTVGLWLRGPWFDTRYLWPFFRIPEIVNWFCVSKNQKQLNGGKRVLAVLPRAMTGLTLALLEIALWQGVIKSNVK